MSLYSMSLVLCILANQAFAGNCVTKICPDPADIPPPGPWLNQCPNGIPKKWACLDPKIAFPTVDCIAADIKACGTLEAYPLMVNSFGTETVQVRKQDRDKLNPRPVMFNDALPRAWDNEVLHNPRLSLIQGTVHNPDVQKRYDAFVDRCSAALAKAAKDEVMLVTLKCISESGGIGAYSLPKPEHVRPNVWRTYEFPIAQRNKAVTRVVSYALDEPTLNKVVDFEPGKKGDMLPEPKFPDPPLPQIQAPGPPQPVPGPSTPTLGPSQPSSSQPGSSQPGSSKPASSKPASSTPTPGSPKPASTKPASTKPAPSKPAPSKPATKTWKHRAVRRTEATNISE